MKSIGGYPELELRPGVHYHKDAIRLNSARSCLAYILTSRRYRKVYIPYYTCEAVIEAFENCVFQVDYEFYRIDDCLEPVVLPTLNDNEAFLYTNYFGMKGDCVKYLALKFGSRLIVDNSQAFFDMPVLGIDTFYSPRKFFGVPDGGYLYTDAQDDCLLEDIGQDYSYDRMDALLKRIDISAEAGYADFHKIEEEISKQPICRMSKLTERILCSLDYQSIADRRRKNYHTLYYRLFQKNDFWIKCEEEAVPLSYPFRNNNINLRKHLIDNHIFVPTFWPNVLEWCNEGTKEYQLAINLLPLPIDQRYDRDDMKRIADIILLSEGRDIGN